MSFHSNTSTQNGHVNVERRQPVIASIIVYLQKNDHLDDILTIHRLQNGHFRATFFHRTVNREYVTEIRDYNNLIEYLDTFMMMTVIDRDSYDFIQVDIPGLPAVLIRPCRRDWDMLYDHIRTYLRRITTTGYDWPKEFSLRSL